MAWWWDDGDPAKAGSQPTKGSVYEDPARLGAIARLRRWFRGEDPGKELILTEDGEPRLVVEGGRLAGFRCKDGSVAPVAEQPVEEWLESDWGDGNDIEYVLIGGRWRRRWR